MIYNKSYYILKIEKLHQSLYKWNLLLWFKLTHLCFGPQVLLSIDLERQLLGHLQFLNVSSRRRSESWQSTGKCGCGGGSSRGTGRRPGCRQILHPLLRVEHALNLLLNLRRTYGSDVLELKHIYKYTRYTRPNKYTTRLPIQSI